MSSTRNAHVMAHVTMPHQHYAEQLGAGTPHQIEEDIDFEPNFRAVFDGQHKLITNLLNEIYDTTVSLRMRLLGESNAKLPNDTAGKEQAEPIVDVGVLADVENRNENYRQMLNTIHSMLHNLHSRV